MKNVITMGMLISFMLLSSCSWVQTTEQGKMVTLVKDFNVKDCKKIGSTTTSVKDKIGFIERDKKSVMAELTALAKNTAAGLGGDSIVATSPEKDGMMTFDIYKCAP